MDAFYTALDQVFSKFEDDADSAADSFADAWRSAFDIFLETGHMLDAAESFGNSLKEEGLLALEEIFKADAFLEAFSPILFDSEYYAQEIQKITATYAEDPARMFEEGALLWAQGAAAMDDALRELGFDVAAEDWTDYVDDLNQISGDWGAITDIEGAQVSFVFEVHDNNFWGMEDFVDIVIDEIKSRTDGDIV